MKQTSMNSWRELCNSIPGTTSYRQCFALYLLSKSLPSQSTIVEIGTGLGRTAASLAYGCDSNTKHVFSIDNYSPQEVSRYSTCNQEWGTSKAKEYIDRLGLLERISLISGDSKEVSKTFTRQINLLFIDGDHSYTGVIADIQSWVPKVVTGGYIVFHDFNVFTEPWVTKAVTEAICNHVVIPMFKVEKLLVTIKT